MTFSEIETRVRYLVNDSDEPHRFGQRELWGYAIAALRRLRVVNPSTRYRDGLIDDSEPVPSLDSVIPVWPRHEEAIIDYVAYCLYRLDASDTTNATLAENFLGRAETLMRT